MMSKVAEKSVKYPSPRVKGMQEFVEVLQDANWKPPRIDVSLLKMLGIAKGKEGLLLQALRFLGIIDEAGVPTGEFDNLKKDYQSTLRRLVEKQYGNLLSLLPRTKVNQARLVNYFGNPVETAEYQAKFFVWLCEQAGIELPNVEKKFHRARFDKSRKTE